MIYLTLVEHQSNIILFVELDMIKTVLMQAIYMSLTKILIMVRIIQVRTGLIGQTMTKTSILRGYPKHKTALMLIKGFYHSYKFIKTG
ncbi:hypothetical protein DI43_19305 [Geobacillus sp. CAMR12739]|nr:hypothetical protein DI43_19305 [Geobacillus sp. CAMR12739]